MTTTKTDWGKVTRCPKCEWYIGNKVLKAHNGDCPNCGATIK
jgi:predicted RNA-binding Zn-ribbon protein involved in translation (DUF1610 family)